jgi:uncharacterized protein YjiK
VSIKILFQIIIVFVISSCDSGGNSTQESPFLKEEATFNLTIPEPSGLALSIDKTFLWTVSDKTNKVYTLDFEGKTLSELAYSGNDLEGIVQSKKDSTIWVVEENLSQIVQLDILGNLKNSFTVNDAGGTNGLEGISINDLTNHFFLLKEQNPGVFIELAENFDLLQYKEIRFADDYSGITYDSKNHVLWILSDQDQKVYEYTLDGMVINEYKINLDKAEGIAIDSVNDLIYIVSDSEAKLYVFSIHKN